MLEKYFNVFSLVVTLDHSRSLVVVRGHSCVLLDTIFFVYLLSSLFFICFVVSFLFLSRTKVCFKLTSDTSSLPADVLWVRLSGRNECVTNEPQRTSARRLRHFWMPRNSSEIYADWLTPLGQPRFQGLLVFQYGDVTLIWVSLLILL